MGALAAAACAITGAMSFAPVRASAQQARIPLSRAAAIDAALRRGVRLPTAQADTLVAAAQLLTARALANPTLTASYSKSVPQYHAELDLPIPFPWIRSARVGSARFAISAARLRYSFARASAALDADTSYTIALAALERTKLSARTAADADTLLRMAIARRDAGDASDLDVELARVNAGQQANAAASDSLTLRSALLELQLAIGMTGDTAELFPSDSLTAPPATDSLAGEPLGVATAGGPGVMPYLTPFMQGRGRPASRDARPNGGTEIDLGRAKHPRGNRDARSERWGARDPPDRGARAAVAVL